MLISKMAIMTQKDKAIKELSRRQDKLEEALNTMREIVDREIDEERIRPSVIKRWDRISREMDNGKVGHTFNSVQEMRKWLKNL